MKIAFRPIGWTWIAYALSHFYELMTSVYLSGDSDPEAAMASSQQAQKRLQRFAFEVTLEKSA
jgi:hypothetical protein